MRATCTMINTHMQSLGSSRRQRRSTNVVPSRVSDVEVESCLGSSQRKVRLCASSSAGTETEAEKEDVSPLQRVLKQLPPFGPVTLARWGLLRLWRAVVGEDDAHVFLPISIARCSAEYPPFVFVSGGDSFMSTLNALAAEGKLNDKVRAGLVELFENYRGALMSSPRQTDADAEAAKMISSIAERVALQYRDPYTFPSRHERILSPFDYYAFGQRYCGNLINFRSSYVGNVAGFREVKAQLERGENVVLMANHQSEADPGVWAWMTQYIDANLATDMRYVAGDRVVLDTFAKPFSMGRNLVCVHSKRHMGDDPVIRAEKMKTNQRSVRELGILFREGGALLWIAPSGGRDRVDPETDEYKPAAFDPAAVQLMRRLLAKASSKHPGHVYPMAMASAEIMPPPRGVQKELGEERVLNYHGVGIALGEELREEDIVAAASSDAPGGDNASEPSDDDEDDSQQYCDYLYAKVCDLYGPLAKAVYGRTDAAELNVGLEQPWDGKGL